MYLRGGGHKRSPRHAVITRAALLSAMSLSVVKATLKYVCTLRPLPLSLYPQAPCPSRGNPALPGCAHVHNTNNPPLKPLLVIRVNMPSPYNAHSPHQHCPPKRNKTEQKRDKMAPHCFPCQSSWQAQAENPRGGSGWRWRWWRRWQVKLLCYSAVTLLAFVCPFAIGEHRRARWFPCMSCMLIWQITPNAAFLPVWGAGGVSQEQAVQGNRNTHSMRY